VTEPEWTTCTDPGAMLEFLRGKASDRKLRLFAVACSRRLPLDSHPAEELKNALALAERVADGTATDEEWRATYDTIIGRTLNEETIAILRVLDPDVHAAVAAVTYAAQARQYPEPMRARERVSQAALIREVALNRFRPVTVPAEVLAWNDRLVVRLAQAIYDERRWGDMPLLGDALLDAGCESEDMVSHAREQGSVHTRGCWLLDLLLDKG
jgi:hypothetical protein